VPVSQKASELTTRFEVQNYFNLHDVAVTIPGNEITAVTGFSGAGKTSLFLDSLVPAIQAAKNKAALPKQVTTLQTHLKDVVSVDA